MNPAPLARPERVEAEGPASSAPSPPLASKRNVPLLDALRGFSALGVLVLHTQTPGAAARSGAVFVDIFMAISGFLMTHHYILREAKEPWGSKATIQMFYLRRFFRIAPLYYCGLIYFFLVWGNESHGPDHSVTWNAIQHVTFLFGFMQQQAWTRMPDWSLGLEMQFYLAFPFLMLWLKRSGPVPLLLLAAFIAFAANRLFGVYSIDTPGLLGLYGQPSILPLKFTLFTFGMLAAYIYWKRVKLQWPFIGLLALASALPYKHGHSWFVLSVFGLVLTATQSPMVGNFARYWLSKLNDFCKNWLFHYMAEYSYAVYLIQGFVIGFVENHFGKVLLDRGLFFHWCFILTMVLLITYPVAFVLQHLIEAPGIALGRHLCSKLSGPKRTPVAEG